MSTDLAEAPAIRGPQIRVRKCSLTVVTTRTAFPRTIRS
jgi:hypothetical protein